MKNIFKTVLTFSLLWATQAMAQSDVKPSLDAASVPAPTTAVEAAPASVSSGSEVVKPKPAWQGPRLNYGLSVGASFNSQFGAASYVEPSVRYHINDRFRVHASLTYMNVMAHNVPLRSVEGTTVLYRNNASNHFITSVGVDYLASDRLILSGNIWRDFSNIPAQNLGNSFYNPGRMGADFRATYKITEHLSVTGGIRYSNGASPFYGPGYGSSYGSPFSIY